MKRTKIKPAKFALYLVIFSIIITLTGSAGYFLFFPRDRLIGAAVKYLVSSTSCATMIGNIIPGPRGITLTNVTIHEGSDAGSPVLLSAHAINLSIRWRSLLDGRIDIRGITISDAALRVSFREDGSTEIEHIIRRSTKPAKNEESGLRVEIATVTFDSLTVTVPNPKGPYAPLIGTYRLDGVLGIHEKGLLTLNHAVIHLPEGGLIRPRLAFVRDPKTLFKLTGTVKLEAASIAWTYRWASRPILPFDKVTGMVTGLMIDQSEVSGNVNAVSTLAGTNQLIQASGRCVVNWDYSTVLISAARGAMPDSEIELARAFYNYDSGYLEFESLIKNLVIGTARLYYPSIPRGLSGRISGMASLGKPGLTADLNLSDIAFGNERKIFSGINGTVAIRENRFRIDSLPLTVFGFPATLSSTSTDGSMETIFVNLALPAFHYKRQASVKDSVLPSFDLPLTLTGRITIGSLRVEKLLLGDVSLDYSARGKKFEIKRLSMGIFGGSLYGRGTLDFRDKAELSATTTFQGIRMQDVVSDSERFNRRFFGILTGRGLFSIPIGESNLDNFKGQFMFSVEKGKIVDTGIQDGLGVMLAEQKYKLKDLEFSAISGKIGIKGKSIRLDDFLFDAPDIRLNVKGTLTSQLIADPSLDLDLYFTRKFIEDLPRAAVTLMGLEKSFQNGWYHLPYVIRGDISAGKNLKGIGNQ